MFKVFDKKGIGYLPVALLLFVLLVFQPAVFATEQKIPLASDLGKTAQLAQQQGIPTIIFVTRDGCPYCRTLRNSVLLPMFAAGKFAQKATLLEVNLDQVEPITGFAGEWLTGQDFGELYQAEMTPTLLFLDAQGREISQRRIGISSLEYYGYYLERAIEESRAMLSGRIKP